MGITSSTQKRLEMKAETRKERELWRFIERGYV
jgi:hypothetical protein